MPARVLGPRDGKAGFLGSIGVRFMVNAMESGGGFSLVEHPMGPRALAAPLHKHSREDEYSFILEGEVGALLGDEVLIGKPGDLIFKPRPPMAHVFGMRAIIPRACLRSSHPRASRSSSVNSLIWEA